VDPLARASAYLEWLIDRPVAELSRAQRFLRFAVDLTRHCSRELRQDDAGQMAAALTYRTIFGLVPLLMVSMLAFRMFGDMEAAYRQLQTAAYSFFNFTVDTSSPEALAFKTQLDDRLLDIMHSVGSLSFQTIGVVGALLLIWAALSLLVSFENAANEIYRAPRGRGTLHRVVVYWTVLTLGPILLLLVLYAAEFWLGFGEALPFVGPVFALFGEFGILAGSFVALSLVYKLVPNTLVKWRPALVGALVAAALGHVSKWGFGLYVSRAMPYMKVYGAIGLIPLFLFWMYLNWLIVLFGLELAFTLQGMRGRAFAEHDRDTGLAVSDPLWLVPLMATIARRFGDGVPVSRQDLAEELQLRLESVAELADQLEDEGLLLQVSKRGSEDVGLTLALPPEKIPLRRLVDLGARLTVGAGDRTGPGWSFLQTLHEAGQHAAGERTLADVLADPGIPVPA